MLLKLGKVLHGMQNKSRDERGFTLIELLVVVIIIGILAAIAIPVFLGQRENAQDAASTSDLRNGAAAMEAYFEDDQTYATATVADLEAIEPSIEWVDSGTPTAGQVDLTTLNANDYVLTTESASGNGFTITKNNDGTTISDPIP